MNLGCDWKLTLPRVGIGIGSQRDINRAIASGRSSGEDTLTRNQRHHQADRPPGLRETSHRGVEFPDQTNFQHAVNLHHSAHVGLVVRRDASLLLLPAGEKQLAFWSTICVDTRDDPISCVDLQPPRSQLKSQDPLGRLGNPPLDRQLAHPLWYPYPEMAVVPPDHRRCRTVAANGQRRPDRKLPRQRHRALGSRVDAGSEREPVSLNLQ